jgi:hypothetical protein
MRLGRSFAGLKRSVRRIVGSYTRHAPSVVSQVLRKHGAGGKRGSMPPLSARTLTIGRSCA